MTCIVAITDGIRTVMGADSAAGSPDHSEIYNVATSKVFATGEYLVGVCGSYRAGQVARWEMAWPEPPAAGVDLEGFFVRDVVKNLRRSLEEAAYEGSKKAQFLVALRGQLFNIGYDSSATRLDATWMAIGSGRYTAYGALQVLADLDLPLEHKVLRTLAAAQVHTSNVREPFHVFSVG